MRTLLLVLSLILAAPIAAWSVDGVLEINQTCAEQRGPTAGDDPGCFAGDTDGFPVTIDGSAGRSYRLTSDLIVPDENTDGIGVSTSDVGIDLNNFAIIRSGCEGIATDCTPTAGTGSGVERMSSGNRGISVKNGSITGMGRYGVFLGAQAQVTNLRVRWNRLDGILADNGSIVSGNTAYQNGNDGIDAGSGVTIIGNASHDNGDAIEPETDDGIECDDGCIIRGNSVRSNSGDGIFAEAGSTVSDNSASDNGGDGIHVKGSSMVRGNNVFSNRGYGLNLEASTRSGYTENVVSGNTLGTVNPGKQFGENLCDGSIVACPSLP